MYSEKGYSMKLNVVGKLFISILSIFVFVMMLQIVFHEFLLDPVYQLTKEREVSKVFNEASTSYKNNNPINTAKYFDQSEAYLTFVNTDGTIQVENFLDQLNYIEVNGHKVIFEGLFDDEGNLYNNMAIKVGQIVTVEYYPLYGTDYFIGYEISVQSNVYYSELSWKLEDDEDSQLIEELSGEVTKLKGHNRSNGTLGYQAIRMLEEVYHILNEIRTNGSLYLEKSDSDIYRFVDEDSGLHYVVMVEVIKEKGTVGQDVLAITLFEIAELSRAFSIISQYYYYLYSVQILLIIGLAFLFSKWFTKPLLALNENAKAISKEDFSKRTVINTNDELEELSNNMNMIAENLANSMANLENYAKDKEKSEDRMRQLLMDMSHEFKTPLGIMSGFIEIVIDGVNEKSVDYYLENIAIELEGLDELVRNTLELTRLESDVSVLSKEEVDFKKLIELSIEKFKQQLCEKSLKLEMNLSYYMVMVDVHKMLRVLNNLISNAVKYSPIGGKIIITMDIESEGCKVVVANTNEAFTDEEMLNMFDRYYRGDASRNSRAGGHGLGLSIVKNILEQHEFTYSVDYNQQQVRVSFYLH